MKKFFGKNRVAIAMMIMAGLAVLITVVSASSCLAKDIYPRKRITCVVYTRPGGGFDVIARTLMPFLEKHLKEMSPGAKGGEVVIKNTPQAGGRRAFSTVFHARPDGYTIGDFNAAYATTDIVAKTKSKFDYTQFTFLLRAGVSKRVILAKKGRFKNWEDMLKEDKQKELKWAASNFGRGHHVTCILLKEEAKMNIRLINFPGAAENINALMRGDVDIAIAAMESAGPMISAGEFEALAVLSEKSELSGVPSIAELGFEEIAGILQLHRIFIAPPKLEKEPKDKLISAFKRVFKDPEYLAQAKKINFEPEPLYGDDAEKTIKKVFDAYRKRANILKKYLAQ